MPGTTAIYILASHVTGFDPVSADGLSDALVALRRQSREMFDLLKNHTEEFHDIEFGPFSSLPGLRESRRVLCDAMITKDDVVSGRHFDDGLFLVTQAIDLHKCTEDEPFVSVQHVVPYHVPYRSLLPKGLENVMVVGRCIGGDHEAHGSYRIMGDCFAMGEAAGIAAKMAIEKRCSLRRIPVGDLVAEMAARGYQQ